MTHSAEHILLIAGTGRNSRKTTLACKIIEKFSDKGIIGVKISPHFHSQPRGTELLIREKGFNIYRENSIANGKDSARMLAAGAREVFYIEVQDAALKAAFLALNKFIPDSTPVVCESPALRKLIKPGIFLIVDHPDTMHKKQEVLQWEAVADAFMDTSKIRFEEIMEQIEIEKGGWIYLE